MNSSSSTNTYITFQNHIIKQPKDICCLIEVISKNSQNISWKISINNKVIYDERIRRISIDKFYEIVIGDKLAFYNLCKILPIALEEVLKESELKKTEEDKVIEQLQQIDKNILKSLFKLAFNKYNCFNNF